MTNRKTISIIGGGSAALMLAAHLDPSLFQITIFEQKKSVGRKFLVAGEGGLNLTYHESITSLIQKYVPADFMGPMLQDFTNLDLIDWLQKQEILTFIGSSNRVFPVKKLKPIMVLNKILATLQKNKVTIRNDKKWMGWTEEDALVFSDGEIVASDITVFALGGASWKVTGSDGNWREIFMNKGITVHPFRAANCVFQVNWEHDFITAHRGKPLKNIALAFKEYTFRGELVVTKFGLEGNAIYALSEKIQNHLRSEKKATVYLDLKPTLTVAELITKYQNSKSEKITNRLKVELNLDRTAIALIKNCTDRTTFQNPDSLCHAIKNLPIVLRGPDDLDKAISSLGGIDLSEVNEWMELKKIPATYAIGEMLDWYAPTGGYLLQGCFSMGAGLAKHLNK